MRIGWKHRLHDARIHYRPYTKVIPYRKPLLLLCRVKILYSFWFISCITISKFCVWAAVCCFIST